MNKMNERFQRIQNIMDRFLSNNDSVNKRAFDWFLECVWDRCKDQTEMDMDDILYHLEEAMDAANINA